MDKTRKIYRGISKAAFKNKKEYSFTEAREILGPCKRKELTYLEQKQYYYPERNQWDAATDAAAFETYPPGWFDNCTPKILEKYDVWVNERGDMLLAQPLPENTLNINNFKL